MYLGGVMIIFFRGERALGPYFYAPFVLRFVPLLLDSWLWEFYSRWTKLLISNLIYVYNGDAVATSRKYYV